MQFKQVDHTNKSGNVKDCLGICMITQMVLHFRTEIELPYTMSGKVGQFGC